MVSLNILTITTQDVAAGVCLSGSFNGWEKQPMVKTDGEYTVALELPPGQYEYKVILHYFYFSKLFWTILDSFLLHSVDKLIVSFVR